MVVKSSGFTFIELILVIIILGILSAFALPRFIDFRSSVLDATLDGMVGAMRSGSDIIHAKALAEGKTIGSDTVTVSGANIEIHSGYAIANYTRAVRYLMNQDDVGFSNRGTVCNSEWCGRGNQRSVPGYGSVASGLGAKIWPREYTWEDSCGVYFINLENGTPPIIGAATSC